LYNRTFGGWSPSELVVNLYNARMKTYHWFEPVDGYTITQLKRHDPILVELYYSLGNKFDESSQISSTAVEKVPIEYKDYYRIEEFDGNESVEIDKEKYKCDKQTLTITDLLKNDSMTNDEKIKELNKMFSI
jgi:hypothetical protein